MCILQGLYYSYYKTMIKSPTFFEGLSAVMNDNVTEYPSTINVLKRFNLYPEVSITNNTVIVTKIGGNCDAFLYSQEKVILHTHRYRRLFHAYDGHYICFICTAFSYAHASLYTNSTTPLLQCPGSETAVSQDWGFTSIHLLDA